MQTTNLGCFHLFELCPRCWILSSQMAAERLLVPFPYRAFDITLRGQDLPRGVPPDDCGTSAGINKAAATE
jgi:hypothetical protein